MTSAADPGARQMVTSGEGRLTVPIGYRGRTTSISADWYFPPVATAAGLVWLQHGFARRRANVAGLARSIASAADAIVVAPSVSSNALSPSGCWINGLALHRAVARLFGECFGTLEVGADEAARAAGIARILLPRAFVIAGHSAGGNLATSSAGYTTVDTVDGRPDSPPAATNLRGVVLLDAVDHAGVMDRGLGRLSGQFARPVWTIAAPDSRCNAHGRGTKVLQRARAGQFVGVRLAGGTHVDAEGEEPGRFATAMCGVPLPENVAGLRDLAAGWIRNLLNGIDTPAYLAGTPSGTVTTLKGGAGATTL